MSYTKKTWKDYPETTTPVNAENLNHIENGISNVDSRVTTLENQTASDVPYGNTNVASAITSLNSSVSTLNSSVSSLNSSVNSINSTIPNCVKALGTTTTINANSNWNNVGTISQLSGGVVNIFITLEAGYFSGNNYTPLKWKKENGYIYVGKGDDGSVSTSQVVSVSCSIYILYV